MVEPSTRHEARGMIYNGSIEKLADFRPGTWDFPPPLLPLILPDLPWPRGDWFAEEQYQTQGSTLVQYCFGRLLFTEVGGSFLHSIAETLVVSNTHCSWARGGGEFGKHPLEVSQNFSPYTPNWDKSFLFIIPKPNLILKAMKICKSRRF